jgi:SNF2 family DNA or RNA helicase
MNEFTGMAVKCDGRDNLVARDQVVQDFQNKPAIRLFVGNIRAAGTGITLTAASNTVFLELDWSPGIHDQAEDRVHRIGQKESVMAWYLLADGTLETKIAAMLDRKRNVVNKVLDGIDASSKELLTELLQELEMEGEDSGTAN